jgi:hypothetical protein
MQHSRRERTATAFPICVHSNPVSMEPLSNVDQGCQCPHRHRRRLIAIASGYSGATAAASSRTSSQQLLSRAAPLRRTCRCDLRTLLFLRISCRPKTITIRLFRQWASSYRRHRRPRYYSDPVRPVQRLPFSYPWPAARRRVSYGVG